MRLPAVIACNARVEQERRAAKSKENISPAKRPGVTSGKKRSGKNLVTPGTIASLQEEISYLWEIYHIEKSQQDSFMDSLTGLQPKMYIQLLAKEIENLCNEKSTIQLVAAAIQRREESIKCVHQIISYISTSQPTADIREQVCVRA